MTFLKYMGKSCGFLGYAFQYACVTHCAFEYIGDFVMVKTVLKRTQRTPTPCSLVVSTPRVNMKSQRRGVRAALACCNKVQATVRVVGVEAGHHDQHVEAAKCSGPSMEPTLETNNILLTEHISPRLQRLSRGDIIIAKSPTNPKQNICKRITGLPGDKVRGHFPRWSQVVPRGHVWLEGDNSSNSADSRVYGPVPHGLIRSRVVCRVWPLNKISSLTEY